MSGHTMPGYGQRGHNREDRTLHERICDALERHPDLEASGVEVLVDDGEVFLSGTVFTDEERRLAERVVSMTAGDRPVFNRLQLFTDGPVAPRSNLATESTVDGATMHTENGDYDVLS